MAAPELLNGILILGTETACGKTAITAGLSAAIQAAGFRVQAFKPLAFTNTEKTLETDQRFINAVTRQYIQTETLGAASSWDVSVPLWNKVLEQCKQLQYPFLLEAPGQVATPWQILNRQWTDGSQIAQTMGLSVLLVTKADHQFLEKTLCALGYLKTQGIPPMGFIQVQTALEEDNPNLQAETLLLCQQEAIPFLGCLPYSPSINVPQLQQGNLIRLIEANIDLLPLQLALGLAIA